MFASLTQNKNQLAMKKLVARGSKAGVIENGSLTDSGYSIEAPAAHYRGETMLSLDGASKMKPELVSLLNRDSIDAERYRRLRHSVEKLKEKDKSLVVAITSPVSGDGKTLTSINLAGALAQNPLSRVLLIELDLRQPFANVTNYLGTQKLAQTGVVDLMLDEELPWEKATYYIPNFNLYLMPAGGHTSSAYELLTSERMGEVLTQARERYDYVIIDTAPVVLLPDSQLIAEWVDGFLMVIAADTTPRKLLEEALSLMEQNKVLGLIFNGYAPVSNSYGGYY